VTAIWIDKVEKSLQQQIRNPRYQCGCTSALFSTSRKAVHINRY